MQTIGSPLDPNMRLTVYTAADMRLMNALDEMLGSLEDVEIRAQQNF
jgi:hypothetical protein